MEKRKPSPRFEVSVNGRRACISGLDGDGVLTVVLYWVRRSSNSYPGKKRHPLGWSKSAWTKERILLEVSGMPGLESGEHLTWLKRAIRVGDRIALKLLPPGNYDPPKSARGRLTARSRAARRERRAPKRER